MALQTSDKVGLVACIVLAIVIIILVLWPRGKAKPKNGGEQPKPKTIGAAPAAVDEAGVPTLGAEPSDAAPRLAVVEEPKPAATAPKFHNPGKPPEII